MAQFGCRISLCTKYPRCWRDGDWPRTKQLANSVGMKRSSTSEGNEGEILRVVTLFYRYVSEGIVHPLIDQIVNSLGSLIGTEAHLTGYIFNSSCGNRNVERKCSS